MKAEADSILHLGVNHIRTGDYSSATALVEKSLNLYKKTNDPKSVGISLGRLGVIHYFKGEYLQCLRYYDQSIAIYKDINYQEGIASLLNNKGAVYFYLGSYLKALDHYIQAAKMSEKIDDEEQILIANQNLAAVYLELENYASAMTYFQKAQEIYDKNNDVGKLTHVVNGIGETYARQQKYKEALSNFEKALALTDQTRDAQKRTEVLYNLGDIYYATNDYKKAIQYFDQSLSLAKQANNQIYISNNLVSKGNIYLEEQRYSEAISTCQKGLSIATLIGAAHLKSNAFNCLYKGYRDRKLYTKALFAYEQMRLLEDSLHLKEASEKALSFKFEKQILLDSLAQDEKERKIEFNHYTELQKKKQQRNIILLFGLFILTTAIGLLSRLKYIKKTKKILQTEKDRSEYLLHNILPEEIACELKEKGYVEARDFTNASVLFTDFKSFTETASRMSPQALVEEINTCFKAFDHIIEELGVEKIKTIGDAYMAVGGLGGNETKAIKNIVLAGIKMQSFINNRKQKMEVLGKPYFEMRVGIHVGPVVAGVVGVKKFQYDVWGDTVNIASRMESSGMTGRVNISDNIYQMIKHEKGFEFEFRGDITVKGKGKMKMYFVAIPISPNKEKNGLPDAHILNLSKVGMIDKE